MSGDGQRLGGGEMIAIRRIQRLHVGVRQIDQLPHLRLSRVFGGDVDVRLVHLWPNAGASYAIVGRPHRPVNLRDCDQKTSCCRSSVTEN